MTLTELEIRNHFVAMQRTARRLTGNHVDADDIVQEAIIRAMTYAGDGCHVGNWRGYLTRIVRNVVADAYKKRARQGVTVTLDDEDGTLATNLSTLPNQYDCRRVRELEMAMEELPCGQNEVIRLVAIDGWSYRDAADRLGVPVGTVMSRLYRGRETLKNRLESAGVPHPAAIPQGDTPAPLTA